jgi:hypothetical protein
MSKPIQEAHQLVAACQQEVQKFLSGPQHNRNLLSINSNFRVILEHLKFMGGVLEPEKKSAGNERFPPMTTFMGRPLKSANGKSTSEEIIPKNPEKEVYLAKVEKLYNEIGNTAPSIIMNAYTQEHDIAVLRGVAKLAGLENFKEAEINTEFIQAIQVAIEQKAEEKQQLADIDKASKVATEVTITAEDIEKSTYLKKAKARPGDKFMKHPDGKYEPIKSPSA